MAWPSFSHLDPSPPSLPETGHNENDPEAEQDDPQNQKRPRARGRESKHRRTDE